MKKFTRERERYTEREIERGKRRGPIEDCVVFGAANGKSETQRNEMKRKQKRKRNKKHEERERRKRETSDRRKLAISEWNA